MKAMRILVALTLAFAVTEIFANAQQSNRREMYLGISAKHKSAVPLPPPSGLQDHVANGKLVLTLDDTIRLALANNTDIHLNYSQVELAQNNLVRSHQFFDPLTTASFSDQRATFPTTTQIQGAPLLTSLLQETTFGYAQTFQTGTKFEAAFIADKLSTNDAFSFVNPSISTSLTLTVTQPLLRNFGLFPNRAPILIAQRNLRESRSAFHGEVNDTILTAVGAYWDVVLARENLVVQKKSLEEAQASYDHDKKALGLGALPPLDIYRSESQVASRRVAVIQAEYSLKQAEDTFKQSIGADLDPATRVMDLELTESPEPNMVLVDMDIPAALSRALINRPELVAAQEQLAVDELGVRLAHNNLRPDLELSGFYSGNGLAGNQLDTSAPLGVNRTGLGTGLSQVFQFSYPAYGAKLSLNLPIKNHAAQADLGDALAGRRHDQYQQRQTNQSIELEVTNAVHALEEAKITMEAAKVATDLAQKTLHAEQRKYELGTEQIFFVLDAQTQLAQAELSLIQAQINYQLAVAAVDHATGDLLDHHHVQIQDPSK